MVPIGVGWMTRRLRRLAEQARDGTILMGRERSCSSIFVAESPL